MVEHFTILDDFNNTWIIISDLRNYVLKTKFSLYRLKLAVTLTFILLDCLFKLPATEWMNAPLKRLRTHDYYAVIKLHLALCRPIQSRLQHDSNSVIKLHLQEVNNMIKLRHISKAVLTLNWPTWGVPRYSTFVFRAFYYFCFPFFHRYFF